MATHFVTDEAYLRAERDPAIHDRHELLHGVITMMPGGTPLHSNLGGRMASLLQPVADEEGCDVFNSRMKVRVPDTGYLYPDVSIACGPHFEGRDILLKPSTVVEVLSPSTERRDRTVKFDAYPLIPSLTEIVFVSTEIRSVEVFRRDAAGWRVTFAREGGTAHLTERDIPIPLDRLYASFDRLKEPESPTS